MQLCRHCKQEFKPTRPTQVFCSPAHRLAKHQAARRKRIRKETGKAYQPPNILRMQEWRDSLKTGPCMDCGGTFPPCCMDFDHRDRATKIMPVSWMFARGKPRADILAEIAKCDLVCANCHRIRTLDRSFVV